MMEWRLTEIARQTAGRLRGPDGLCRGISIDTRTLVPGNLFVALSGRVADGHDFAGRALAGGAGGVLIAERAGLTCEPAVVVADPLHALGELARAWRRQLRAPVAAITGSNGKTTVKEMLGAVLRTAGRVLATAGNYNNQIGVPLTLLNGEEAPDFVVLELGTSRPGEIALLGTLAEPDLALVTNAQAAHLEGLGTVEAVAREKGSLYEALAPTGVAILPEEDPHAPEWRRRIGSRPLVTFGWERGDFHFAAPPRWNRHEARWEGFAVVGGDGYPITLPLIGRHNLVHALAAAAAASAWHIPPAQSLAALSRFHGVPRRLQLRPGPGSSHILDDSYNANPESLLAGIESALGFGDPVWLALGDLAELGPAESEWHDTLGHEARRLGVARVYATGALMQLFVHAFGSAGGAWFRDSGTLIDVLRRDLEGQAVLVLVKGSHSARMEEVADALSRAEEGSRARLVH
jgi:UDP-N-acetylmuramoyl-tripeptide--D-alanyl-D-alanine ligase